MGWGGVSLVLYGISCIYLTSTVFSSVSVFAYESCVRACVRSPFYARGYDLPFGSAVVIRYGMLPCCGTRRRLSTRRSCSDRFEALSEAAGRG